jgi:undecaprenyl-diphosphatase
VVSSPVGSVRPRALFFLLAVAVTLFHLWYVDQGFLDLTPDEAHYWEWSRRLDWSYYSKGPMVAYLIAAGTWLAGHTELGVRLPAVCLAFLIAVLAFVTAARLLGSERQALWVVVLFLSAPLYAAGSILMTTDPPFLLAWGLALLALHGALLRERPAGWYGAGIALGLGLLTKFTMLLLLPCLALYLLATRSLRRTMGRPEPWIGLGLAGLLAAPVIVWNARHGWVSLRHVAGQTGLGGDSALAPGLALEFVGSQAGVISPLLLAAVVAGLWRAGRLGLRQADRPQLFLFCFSAPVLGLFLLWSLHAKVQANWPAAGYYAGLMAAASLGAGVLARRRTLGLAGAAAVLLPALAITLVAHFPALPGRLGFPLPKRLDIAARFQGWRDLGAEVTRQLAASPGAVPPFLVSDRYQIASELAFYVDGHPRVFNANFGRRDNQYDVWGGLDDPALRGREALFVTYGDGRTPPELAVAFARAERLEILRLYRRGHLAQTFQIFRGTGYRGFPPAAERRY